MKRRYIVKTEHSKQARTAYRLFATSLLVAMITMLAFTGTTTGKAAPSRQAVDGTFPVADGPGNQVWPRISGNLVAYDECTSRGCRIMSVDLADPGKKRTPVSPSGYNAYMPGIDGKRVVWVDARNASRNGSIYDPANNLNIAGVDLSTGKPFTVTVAAKAQIHPDISGNIVVWTDYRKAKNANDTASGDIYMYNIATGKESLVSGAKGLQTNPVTNGKVVVWVDYRNEPDPDGYNYDIYGFDLATKKEFVVTKNPASQLYPAISGNTLVWADWRSGEGDIYGYDLSRKKEFVVSEAPGMQTMPSISGDLMVWGDYRNEPDPSNGGNVDVYGTSLTTGQEFEVFAGEGAQGAPRISDTNVVWEDNESGDFDNGDWNVAGTTIDLDTATEPTPTEEGNQQASPQPTAAPYQPSGALEPGVIKGRVTDTKGAALADVPISIYGTSNAGERVNFSTRTGADGRYSLPVPDGIYRIYGYYRMQYKGRNYSLPVWPVDNIDGVTHASKEGVVKDFIWKISGPSPFAKDDPNRVGNYYGGYADLGDEYYFQLMHGDVFQAGTGIPSGTTIELTLKPDGPLFDGSAGQAIVYKIPSEELASWYIWDIPLGDYTATAQLIDRNGRKTPLRVSSISMANGGEQLSKRTSTPVVFMASAEGMPIGVELYIMP